MKDDEILNLLKSIEATQLAIAAIIVNDPDTKKIPPDSACNTIDAMSVFSNIEQDIINQAKQTVREFIKISHQRNDPSQGV